MANTPKRGLDELAQNDDAPHIVVNGSFRALEQLAQANVLDTVTTLPASPADGDAYIVGAGADSSLTEQSIYFYENTEWTEVVPQEGDRVFDQAANYLKAFDGTTWIVDPSWLYPIHVGIAGQPGAAAEVHREIMAQPVTLATDFAGSVADSGTNASDSGGATFNVSVNGTLIGTVNFDGSSITWATESAADLALAAGDVLVIDAPSSQDSTLADVAITLYAWRVTS